MTATRSRGLRLPKMLHALVNYLCLLLVILDPSCSDEFNIYYTRFRTHISWILNGDDSDGESDTTVGPAESQAGFEKGSRRAREGLEKGSKMIGEVIVYANDIPPNRSPNSNFPSSSNPSPSSKFSSTPLVFQITAKSRPYITTVNMASNTRSRRYYSACSVPAKNSPPPTSSASASTTGPLIPHPTAQAHRPSHLSDDAMQNHLLTFLRERDIEEIEDLRTYLTTDIAHEEFLSNNELDEIEQKKILIRGIQSQLADFDATPLTNFQLATLFELPLTTLAKKAEDAQDNPISVMLTLLPMKTLVQKSKLEELGEFEGIDIGIEFGVEKSSKTQSRKHKLSASAPSRPAKRQRRTKSNNRGADKEFNLGNAKGEVPRSKEERDKCKNRDKHRCVIKRTKYPQGCHIFPYALTKASDGTEALKRRLQAVINLFYTDRPTQLSFIDGFTGATSYGDAAWNMISLSPEMHQLWSEAWWGFKPRGVGADGEGKRVKVKLQFSWLENPECHPDEEAEEDLDAFLNKRAPRRAGDPKGGEGLIAARHTSSGRLLRTGDIFYITCTNEDEARRMHRVLIFQWAALRILSTSGGAGYQDLPLHDYHQRIKIQAWVDAVEDEYREDAAQEEYKEQKKEMETREMVKTIEGESN
ncbi:hypothetical protein QBC44DRAFT_311721 [Cladorrhinum sp. PSN332]|nr:hypothetical protein QBC44DRAFT_311721 [Cladorrhinum sp. PSN332]